VLPFFALAPQAGAVCQEDCDAYNNTFLGDDLFLIGIGSRKCAGRFEALMSNMSLDNTAVGAYALYSNSGGGSRDGDGSWNTATGACASYRNPIGFDNTANGVNALFYNATGDMTSLNAGPKLDTDALRSIAQSV